MLSNKKKIIFVRIFAELFLVLNHQFNAAMQKKKTNTKIFVAAQSAMP